MIAPQIYQTILYQWFMQQQENALTLDFSMTTQHLIVKNLLLEFFIGSISIVTKQIIITDWLNTIAHLQTPQESLFCAPILKPTIMQVHKLINAPFKKIHILTACQQSIVTID